MKIINTKEFTNKNHKIKLVGDGVSVGTRSPAGVSDTQTWSMTVVGEFGFLTTFKESECQAVNEALGTFYKHVNERLRN